MEKTRSLSGDIGICILLLAIFSIFVSFATPTWLVSDPRIMNTQFEKMGLWTHCFKSLPSPYEADAPTIFFVGCRWLFDPFTKGYSDIRPFLRPPFMIATQFFFTLCFLLILLSFGLMLVSVSCYGPQQKRYIQLIQIIGYLLLISGFNGSIAVIIFACFGNREGWMPGHESNYFGWAFAMGVVGSVLALIAGALFLVDAHVQKKKGRYLKESQTRMQSNSNTQDVFF
ncbi:hypothetical protein KPH14_004609 [Odynerus spinipes]|uniref:Uncharacterized protein n=1 Tax=Odynerus spinipes TaxID=1348599 RepID=A0AAD9RN77_9HYME|nr:hypothetical protein KPH14_004609 [Odynerus spinipes]